MMHRIILALALMATVSVAGLTYYDNVTLIGTADGVNYYDLSGAVAPVDVGTPLAWWQMTATGTNATQILDFSTSEAYPADFKPSVASGPVLVTTNGSYYLFAGEQYFDAVDENAFDFGTNTAFSISCWLNWTGSKAESIVAKQKLTGPNFEGFNCHTETGGLLSFQLVGNSGGVNNNKIITVASVSGWTHAVFVYRKGTDPANMEIWMDGANQAVTTNASILSSASFANSIPLQIGSRGGINNLALTGFLDDVRVFTNDLTSTQISNIFTEGRQ